MRVMVTLLFFLGVFSVAVQARADTLPTADEIKAKAAAFAGPEQKNYRETIVGSGSEGDIREVTYRSGDDVRHIFDYAGGLHLESGTYHGESWNLEENGLVVVHAPEPGQAAPDARTLTVKHVSTPFDAFVVSNLNARAAGTRTYYDSVTFRLLRFESVGPSGTRTTSYGDAERFGSRMLAHDWTIVSSDSNLHMRYERTEYVADAATDADVQEPSTKRQIVEFPAGITSVDLPARFIDNNIYVRLNVGSRAVDFLLDTGTQAMYVEASFAREIGLRPVNSATADALGKNSTIYATVPDISIGALHMRDAVVQIYQKPLQFQPANAKAVGVLGFDFLAQLGVTIDYEHQIVRVVPASMFSPPSDPATFALDVRLGSGVPTVTVQVSGFTAERVGLATGSDFELIFYDYFTRRYPRAFSAAEDLGSSDLYGGKGPFLAETFRLHDVRLGSLYLQNFSAFRIPAAEYSGSWDGWIGNVLLSKFVLSLDYTDGRVYLTPTTATKRAMAPVKP
jgi:predicted aspartyl protease